MKFIMLLLCLSCASCIAIAQQDTAAAARYIRAARQSSNEAIAKKDVGAVAKFWQEDYVEVSSDGSLLCGKEAVVADWRAMFEKDPSTRFERQLQQIEFTRGGTVATEKGILIYTSPYYYKGYYTATWRRLNGVWLTQLENFVSAW